MNIINDNNGIEPILKPETELVELEKEEYYFLGTFLRTKSLSLFGYNHIEDKIILVETIDNKIIDLQIKDNKLIPVDTGKEKCTIDSRFVYFEALNKKSAIKRIQKFKKGKLKNLSNLRKYNPEGIKFY